MELLIVCSYYMTSLVKSEMSSHGKVDSMFLLYDIRREVREINSHGTVDSIFLLYDICHEVREMRSLGTVDSMFLLYDILGEVREMSSHERLIVCSYYMTSLVKLER